MLARSKLTQSFSVSQISEKRLMDARVLTIVPQGLVLINFHHDTPARWVGIPTLRIVAIHFKKIPDGLFRMRGSSQVALLLEQQRSRVLPKISKASASKDWHAYLLMAIGYQSSAVSHTCY